VYLGGDAARAIPEGIVESEAAGGVLDCGRLWLAGWHDSVGGFLGGMSVDEEEKGRACHGRRRVRSWM